MESKALEATMASNISFNTTTAIAILAGCNTTDLQSSTVIDYLRSLPMETLLDLSVQTIDATSSSNDGDVLSQLLTRISSLRKRLNFLRVEISQ